MAELYGLIGFPLGHSFSAKYFAEKFVPDDKELVVEMNEKEGGRHQSFVVENSDLVRALTINELSVK